MDHTKETRRCGTFSCNTMGGNPCCIDCPEIAQCEDRCYNHPDKCNLAVRATSRATAMRKLTDRQAFELWRNGLSDAQIAASLGVSRQRIQTWRSDLELPSTAREKIDTKKYRLVRIQDGTYYVVRAGDEF